MDCEFKFNLHVNGSPIWRVKGGQPLCTLEMTRNLILNIQSPNYSYL